MGRLRHLRGQPREHGGLRQQLLLGERRPDPGEDRPEQLALLLGEPRLAAEALHVAVVLPALELPGVDDRAPFRPEEVRAEPVALDARGRPGEEGSDVLVARETEAAGAGRVETPPDAAHRVHLEPLGDLRLVADQPSEARPQQHAALGMRTGQMHGPVEGHDGLAGAGRPRHPGGAVVLAFDELPLRRVQEDRPFLPGIVERPPERLDILHDPEAPLRVGVREGVGIRGGRRPRLGRAAGGELQQRLGGLGRQVVGEVEQRVLGRRADVAQPLHGHAVAQQVVVRRAREDRGPLRQRRARRRGGGGRRRLHLHLHVPRHLDLAHRLADLHELGRPGCRMPPQPPPHRPLVRRVVMVHVAEQEARRGPVDDQPEVAADAGGPEVLVLRPLDLVQIQPRPSRVHLQVERGGLDRLLLLAGQLREAVGEGVGDAELHAYTAKQKSCSSKRATFDPRNTFASLDASAASPSSRGLPRSSRSRSTGTPVMVSISMVIAPCIAGRRPPRHVLLGRYPPRRVAHVLETGFGLLPADAPEDLVDVVPAFRG